MAIRVRASWGDYPGVPFEGPGVEEDWPAGCLVLDQDEELDLRLPLDLSG